MAGKKIKKENKAHNSQKGGRVEKVHPHSRKAKKFARGIKHEEKVGQRFVDKNVKLKSLTNKLQWFHNEFNLVPVCTKELLAQIIEKYFTRFDEELEQIDIENSLIKTRKGRVHASREDSIKITIGNERRDYESCGLELPDFLNQKTFAQFQNWDGLTKDLPQFKTALFTKKMLTKTNKTADGANAEMEAEVDAEGETKTGVEGESDGEGKDSEQEMDT